jgi:iron complex outermembrane receptor protein
LISPTTYAGSNRDQRAHVISVAPFGEANFKITNQITLVAGGRYSNDHKNVYDDLQTVGPNGNMTNVPLDAFFPSNVASAANPLGTQLAPGPIIISPSATFSAFTPRVELKYAPTDEINFYALYAQGYTSGGFVDSTFCDNPAVVNGVHACSFLTQAPLKQENSTNYEGGMKGLFFGKRLEFNVDGYDQKVTNNQDFSGSGGLPHTYNVDTQTYGVEVESTARLTAALTVTANYAYTDGYYTRNVDPLTNENNAGNPLKYTPPNAFSIGATYVWRLVNDSTVTLHGEYQWGQSFSTADDNSTRLYSNLYNATSESNLNAHLDFQSADKRWLISLWGKNLTDHFQIQVADNTGVFTAFPANPATTFWRAEVNEPRTFGITLTFRK